MITREMRPVYVVSFDNTVDKYGQKRKGQQSLRETKMVVKIYSQTNVEDIRYNDVELIGLTYDKEITDENQIQIDGVNYQILYVIPSSRLYQVLMKKG